MTPRATRALEILRAGGEFRYALTTGWRGREQFEWSLVTRGMKHRGYGHHTFYALKAAGFEFASRASGFTGSATYYALKE
jgi:hypothetical protein